MIETPASNELFPAASGAQPKLNPKGETIDYEKLVGAFKEGKVRWASALHTGGIDTIPARANG